MPIMHNSAMAETAAMALQQLLSPVNSLSAEFSQHIKDIDNNQYQTTSGNLSLMKPNHLRWNVVSPIPQLVVSDGKKFWLYDPDLEQVIIQSVSDDFMASPIRVLLGNLNQLNNDFTVTAKPNNNFLLEPKLKHSSFVNVQLRFTHNILSHIIYKDNFGQTTELTLTNVVVNPSLTTDDFKFNIPKGVDIINHAR